MRPSEKEDKIFKMSNFLPSYLLNEEEQTNTSKDISTDEKCNFILEEEDQNDEEIFIPHVDSNSNETDGPVLIKPKTYYSDSHIINRHRPNASVMMMGSNNNSPYLNNRGNFYNDNSNNSYYPPQTYSHNIVPMFNEDPRYIPYTNSNIIPQPYQFTNPMYYQNQYAKSKLSMQYVNQMNMGLGLPSSISPLSYPMNDPIQSFTMYSNNNNNSNNNNSISYINTNPNSNSSFEFEDQSHHNMQYMHSNQNVRQMKKYNSSGNIKNEYNMNNINMSGNLTQKQIQTKSNSTKSESKRKKSSLFLNKSENKAENDIRDFKRFCDGLKCELDQYICSQIGSRIMQKYLSKFPPDIITLMITQLSIHLSKIMIDVYGNYFCQKLINIASNDQRVLILQSIEQSFCDIAKESSGTHVLQALLDINNLKEEEGIILRCIQTHELEMAYDANATHVLQKIIIAIEETKRLHLNQILLENIKDLCLHPRGICVVKKFICATLSNEIINRITEAISKDFLEIAESPYGNYAIQYIIEEWKEDKREPIILLIIDNCTTLSIQKYSTNIIEKILPKLSKEKKEKIINQLFSPSKCYTLISNKIGKYILLKCLDEMEQKQKETIQQELIDNINEPSSTKGRKKLMLINELFNEEESNNNNTLNEK